jgi:hypothetical protein
MKFLTNQFIKKFCLYFLVVSRVKLNNIVNYTKNIYIIIIITIIIKIKNKVDNYPIVRDTGTYWKKWFCTWDLTKSPTRSAV